MKEQAGKFSIQKIIERVQKDGPAGLVAHFRGESGENHDPQSQPAALAELSGKGAQAQRAEKDNTDSIRLEIERLRKEEDVRRQQQEKAAAQKGQAPQQTVREKPGENDKKDFFRSFGRCGRPSNPFSLHRNKIYGKRQIPPWRRGQE